jgi:hypothetical protein
VSEISREQEYIGRLYERVDGLRDGVSARLALALRQDVGTAQSRLDRDAAVFRYGEPGPDELHRAARGAAG